MNTLQNEVLAIAGGLLLLHALFPPHLPTSLSSGGRTLFFVNQVTVTRMESDGRGKVVPVVYEQDVQIDEPRAVIWGFLILGAAGLLIGLLGDKPGEKKVQPRVEVPEPPVGPQDEPYVLEGVSWNPIQGENRFLPGQGLNSAAPSRESRAGQSGDAGTDGGCHDT